jgi:hypothetical protein
MKDKTNPILWFGKFKGMRLKEVPNDYLAFLYGSFGMFRKNGAAALRERGFDREELAYFRTKHPYLGKRPMSEAALAKLPKKRRKPRVQPQNTDPPRGWMKRINWMVKQTGKMIRADLERKAREAAEQSKERGSDAPHTQNG